MARNRHLAEDEIANELYNKSDDETQFSGEDSDVEEEDHLSEDDVQSDEEEGYHELINTEAVNVSAISLNENADPSPSGSPEVPAVAVLPRHDRRIVIPSKRVLKGKNKHCWTTSKAERRARTSAMNIVRSARGPTRMCKNIVDPILCFDLFITEEIVVEIVKWTNVEISIKRRENMTTATFANTCVREIRALFGVLVLTAVMKDNHLSSDELFDTSFSGSRYVAAMSRDRFDYLISCLRFDDKTLRPALRQDDPFIPIRKVWELFITQCRINYTPGEHLTIDEQLLGFRGRCPFRMYIPNKPNKYGIKIPMMCDTGSKYMIDAMPYIGKATKTNGLPQGEFYVKELSRSLHGSNRNITCDNWFTSVPLAKSLLLQPYNLTLVGTIRSNKREIPEEMKNTRSRPVGTSMFCYDGPLTLVSYKPKPSKMVYLLSSCDEQGAINTSSGKPEIVMYYNQTKGGVDTFDQMCSSMSCSRKTNRWPMAMFYGILNMAFVNSYVIYYHNLTTMKQKPLSRKKFMKKLNTQLTEPWMKIRLLTPTLKRSARSAIEAALPKSDGNEAVDEQNEPEPKKRRYCDLCTSKKRRMSKMTCAKCKKCICGEHKKDVCVDCT